MSPLRRNSGRVYDPEKFLEALDRVAELRGRAIGEEEAVCSPMPDDVVCRCIEVNDGERDNCPIHWQDISVGDEVVWTLFEAKDMENTRPLTMSGRVTASLIQDNGVAVVHVTDESSSRGYWIVATDSLRRTVTARDAESTPETPMGD